MTGHRITVCESGIEINALKIVGQQVADFFRQVSENQREETFIRAVEIGTFCLERSRNAQDVEYVKRQVESLMTAVDRKVAAIPDEVQKALLAKIGTNDGQILAPIQGIVNQAVKSTAERLAETKSLFQEIDPSKDTTTAGKVIQSLRELLNPKRTDSLQAAIDNAVRNVTAADGSLASTVKQVVQQAMGPLKDEIDSLAKEIRQQEAIDDALNQTTVKGASYEEDLLLGLQAWAQTAGAEVHHVGTDNKPGDILIRIKAHSLLSTETTLIIARRILCRQVLSRLVPRPYSQELKSLYVDGGLRRRDGWARQTLP